jgi:hypothetical protein
LQHLSRAKATNSSCDTLYAIGDNKCDYQMSILVFVFILSSLAQRGNVAAGDSAAERYWWVWSGDTLGVLEVPSHPKVVHDEYGEGVAFTLSYPDSSYLILHFGGDIHLPFLDGADYAVDSTFNKGSATIRVGHIKGKPLYWREESREHLINILYCNVTKARLPLFENALATFRPWRR